ncbi:MAG TPA: tRNA (cytidine(34)-2'-O)-methyltransferase [Bacilli bacterium]|nr:tRNA (cytidine(34)-2'-O)-methyltransferase [Bacilli bacterium]HPS18729.1 tRNA (cytidine(34)-2'-O)-methyltransferase [Bacilli bacterium]
MIHVVLFRPEKPQNTGNIMRTCVAVHAALHIIGPLSFSLESKDLKRVGLDYIDDLKLFYYPDYQDFQMKHPDEKIFYVTRYANRSYSTFNFSDPVKDYFIMFGRESTGIPHEILRDHPDYLLRLPMVPEARSLNLSNCVAVLVYEILRQQNFLNLSTSESIKGEDFLNKENKGIDEK